MNAKYFKEYNARIHQENLAAGICVYSGCKSKAAPGRKYCNECLAKERERGIRETIKHRQEIMQLLGGVICAVPGCGITDPTMLEFDHKANNGNRNEHPVKFLYRLVKKARTFKGIKEIQKELQVLCSCHNKQKEIFRCRALLWTLALASERLKEFGKGRPVPPQAD